MKTFCIIMAIIAIGAIIALMGIIWYAEKDDGPVKKEDPMVKKFKLL